MQQMNTIKFNQEANIGVFADLQNERLCECGCGESLAGERENKLFKTGHKDKYYYRKKKEKMETIQRKKTQRKSQVLKSYKQFKKDDPYFFRKLKNKILYLDFKTYDNRKMSIRLPLEYIKYRDNISFSNSFQKLIRQDLFEQFPEMKKYVK